MHNFLKENIITNGRKIDKIYKLRKTYIGTFLSNKKIKYKVIQISFCVNHVQISNNIYNLPRQDSEHDGTCIHNNS